MFEYLYQWILNIAFYMVLVTALIQVVPGKDYKKYIRFFTGLVLILLLLTPVLKIFGMGDKLAGLYDSRNYEKEVEKIEESTGRLNDINTASYLPEVPREEDEEKNKIEVEEIVIGR